MSRGNALLSTLRKQMAHLGAPMSPPLFDICRKWKNPPKQLAATFVPFFVKDDDLHLMLTQRSHYLRLHSNDVAFPGGKWELGDLDEVQTCLRETREEIGLDTAAVDIVGKLYPMMIPVGPTVIVPVVGVVPPDCKVTLSSEVTHVFSLPLRRFLSSRDHKLVDHYEPRLGRSFSVHCFSDTIDGVKFDTWGFTAHNIMRLAGAILQEPADYVSWVHLDDPFQEHRESFEKKMMSID